MTLPDDDRDPALWGSAGAALEPHAVDGLRGLLAERFPTAQLHFQPPARPDATSVPAPALSPPAALEDVCAVDPATRLLHATGRSFTDLVRARGGDFGRIPDVVATPRTASEVAAILDWCADAGACCVPFGGGTSVVGGVNAPATERGVVTLQTRHMHRVLEVDAQSRAAHIQAGATGPVLEEQLQATGLTLRFYPQSYEYSTLGGWIATRASGHYATRLTSIDDLVESIAAVTPGGVWESARVPASGAGPSPDRLLLGSEGALGVVTDAWVRLQRRPNHRAGTAVQFPTFTAGTEAVRLVVQAGLDPAGCRLLDPLEAALNGAGAGDAAVLVLGFESSFEPVDAALDAAVALCRDAGGWLESPAAGGHALQQWQRAFVRAPYLRDALIGLGLVVETFETATTWDRLDALVADVTAATERAVGQVCGDGAVTCRITHAYPDGAAVYFTVVAPGTRGSEDRQWAQIKAAASEAIVTAGATITHHHAVGRDHRQWYDRQRPALFAQAFRAAKAAVDPAWLLNPGVLVDARTQATEMP